MGVRHLVAAVGAGAAVAVGVAVSTPAGAVGAPEPAVQLALGDSVAAGVGATPGQGYVQLLNRALTAGRECGGGTAAGCRLELVDLSVPGATTGTLVAGQLPAAVELIAARRATPTPVDDVRLVTLDIGGNDVFTPVITACAADATAPACAATIAERLSLVAANYDRILSALRAAAGPDTRIVVMAYYNPLPACRLAALAPLAQLVLEGGGPVPAGLNDVIRAAAARYGVAVAETAPLVGTEDLVGGTDCLHPDDSGHADVVAAFAAVIDADAVVRPGRGR